MSALDEMRDALHEARTEAATLRIRVCELEAKLVEMANACDPVLNPAGGPEQNRGAAAIRPADPQTSVGRRVPIAGMYPPGWPRCACGDYVLDGKATCERVECHR